MTNDIYITNPEERALAKTCMQWALEAGAFAVRVSLGKNVMEAYLVRDGILDKTSRNADRSLYFHLYVDGRYGTYSTNRLDPENLKSFIEKAVESTRMIAPDEFRSLADPSRTEKNAKRGFELGLYDEEYASITSRARCKAALLGGTTPKASDKKNWTIISHEFEYSDCIDDNYVIDSNGFEGRAVETSYTCTAEITIQTEDGHKYSGFWWSMSPFRKNLDIEGCSSKALEKAVRQIGPKKVRGGKKNMVVDLNCASRLVAPLLAALNTNSIQQCSSFLADSLGKKVFSENLTILDKPRSKGKSGSRLFDSEGVATKDMPIIENGVIKTYFTSTYMANKTGFTPTVESFSLPILTPCLPGKKDGSDILLADLMKSLGDGIYVTGFNGGNCNGVTGDFSYGVEGFVFKDGKIHHPVHEMLITGNFLELWNKLAGAASDGDCGARWQIPSLAFTDVEFSS